MDLSNFDPREAAETGVEIELKIDGEVVYSDEDDKPITFTLKGTYDPAVGELVMKDQNAPKHRTPEEAKKADMKLARAAIIGWSDNFTTNGEKLPFSKANIEKVLDNPVIRRAVLMEVFRQANFMPKR